MKKLALMSFIVLLLCLLAFTVSAEEIPNFTEVENVTVDTSNLGSVAQSDNTSRVLLMDSEGNYATYLTKYITQFKGGYGDPYQFFPYFDALNSATGKNYDVTSIIAIELPEGTQRISNTYSKTSTWSNVMYIKAPSTLVYQQGKSYNLCSNLKVIDYSQASITSLEQEFITNNSSVEAVYFPKGVTAIGRWAIHGLPSLKSVYIPETLESADGMLNNSTGSGKFVFFYTGDINAETGHTNLYTILGNTNIVETKWDTSKTDTQYIDTAKTEGKIYIVYGYSECNAFNNGVHDNKQINNCVNSCTNCGLGTVKHVDANAENITISYANGFTNKGSKHTVCTNEGCGYDVTSEIKPIFETEGYSVPEDGRGEIAVCFIVNKAELAEYEAYADNEYTYGAFAVAYNKIIEKGSINIEDTIKAEVDKEYASFEIKISGFVTDAHKNAQITLGAYMTDKNGNVIYVIPGTPKEGDNYVYVTYNEIANS